MVEAHPVITGQEVQAHGAPIEQQGAEAGFLTVQQQLADEQVVDAEAADMQPEHAGRFPAGRAHLPLDAVEGDESGKGEDEVEAFGFDARLPVRGGEVRKQVQEE